MGTQQRILQVCPALESGGIEQGTLDMAIAVQRAGHHSIVASNGGKMTKFLEAAGIEHIQLPLHQKSPIKIYTNAFALSQLIPEKNVTLVHARSRAPIWAAAMATRKTKTPFVTSCHSPHGAGFLGLKKAYNGGFIYGDKIIAVSDFIADYLKANYVFPEEKLQVIHRGIDTDRFDPQAISTDTIQALKTQWRLPQNKTLILLPGRITRWKGQHVLLSALTQLQDLPVHAVIVGRTESETYFAELQKAIHTHQLQDCVTFTGACEEMPTAYALADIVLSTSTKPEAFGRVAVEAQAMGKPIIATQLGATAETITNQETGLLIAPNDPKTLAEAIKHVINHPSALSAETARKQVLNTFSKKTMCEKTLALYATLQ